jgi:hypothetical protein
VISTGSPSAIHAATRGKRFRKSLMVAVFIVRQICITNLNLSIVKKLVGGFRIVTGEDVWLKQFTCNER